MQLVPPASPPEEAEPGGQKSQTSAALLAVVFPLSHWMHEEAMPVVEE